MECICFEIIILGSKLKKYEKMKREKHAKPKTFVGVVLKRTKHVNIVLLHLFQYFYHITKFNSIISKDPLGFKEENICFS
jgi:hypothetical protein